MDRTLEALRGCSSMAEQKVSNLMTRVRSPSPAPCKTLAKLYWLKQKTAGCCSSGFWQMALTCPPIVPQSYREPKCLIVVGFAYGKRAGPVAVNSSSARAERRAFFMCGAAANPTRSRYLGSSSRARSERAGLSPIPAPAPPADDEAGRISHEHH